MKIQAVSKKYLLMLAFSIISSFSVLFLILTIFPKTRLFDNLSPYSKEAYILTLFAFASTLGASIYYSQKNKNSILEFSLAALFVPVAILLAAMQNKVDFNPIIPLLSTAYVLFFGAYLAYRLLPINAREFFTLNKPTAKKLDYFLFFVGLATILIYGYFGLRDIGKFSAVDEPLWTFDRIPNFWKDLSELDWKNSRVSDKPGVTVAAISGIGLLDESNPKKFKGMNASKPGWEISDFENFNRTFRIPILIFTLLSIPFFYIAIKKLLGINAAIIFIILLGTSPLLIGNSRIINPDSILWVFVPLSIITFILFLEKEKPIYIYISGFILGLALLTKYTANILFPFFLGLIPFYYILREYETSFADYFKNKLRAYAAFSAIALTTFFVLYPATWEKPDRLFLGTFASQAFAPIWPLFASIIIFLLFDLAILKGRILSTVILFLKRFRKVVVAIILGTFIISIAIVFINTFFGSDLFNFEKILASPKSSRVVAGYPGIFLTDFYPLVYGISIIAIASIIAFMIFNLRLKHQFSKEQRVSIALVLFILIFYLGSTVTHVTMIIRYQIVIFPVIFLLAAISLSQGLQKINNDTFKKVAIGLLLVLSATELALAYPHFDDYASQLLPKKYFINVKDMGSGSYEAAAYLNNLPDAENLKIWTDKNGVCTFFKGKCYTSSKFDSYSSSGIDYLILSSGRQSRSKAMFGGSILSGLKISEWYDSSDYVWKLDLGGRPNNFVKILQLKK